MTFIETEPGLSSSRMPSPRWRPNEAPDLSVIDGLGQSASDEFVQIATHSSAKQRNFFFNSAMLHVDVSGDQEATIVSYDFSTDILTSWQVLRRKARDPYDRSSRTERLVVSPEGSERREEEAIIELSDDPLMKFVGSMPTTLVLAEGAKEILPEHVEHNLKRIPRRKNHLAIVETPEPPEEPAEPMAQVIYLRGSHEFDDPTAA